MTATKDFSKIWNKLAWYAIKATDNRSVASALRLKSFTPATWDKGMEQIRNDLNKAHESLPVKRVFVSPSVDGWVFVIGCWALSHLDHIGLSQMNQLCAELSKCFGEAQNFGTDESIDYCQWVRAKNGELIRSFEYLEGEVFLSPETGLPTQEEVSIFGNQDQANWSPTSNDVLALAGLWSRNPATIGDQAALEGTGFLARTPR